MKYLYTAIFTPEEASYTVRVPDIPHCITRGNTMQEALDLIQDAAAEMLIVMEDEGIPAPVAKNPQEVSTSDGFTSLIAIDTDKTRMLDDSHTVRKSVSIPAWMDNMARREGVSLSQTHQEALRAKFAV